MLRPATVALAALAPALACAQVEQGEPNASFEPAFENQTRAPALDSSAVATSAFAEGLDNAWGIDRLPDGSFIVTERPNGMRMVSAEGELGPFIEGIPEADTRSQGGWLDVTISPDFESDRMVYWTYAKPMGDDQVATAAARGVLSEDGTEMTEVEDIFVQEPPSYSPMHYGSRILFDEDGTVWITTGEHSDPEDAVKAQDLMTTYGKVIRLNPDGSIPEDNPFAEGEAAPGIWSYGHRNIQGATIAPDGTLWINEMGPLGGDELQAPEAGLNYGWPVVSYGLTYEGDPIGSGEARGEGFEEPTYYWDPVIAPAGMTFYEGEAFPDWQGDLLIGSLNPGGLVRIRMEEGRVVGEERMLPDVGRVRDVEELPDGTLLLLIDAPGAEILQVTPAG